MKRLKIYVFEVTVDIVEHGVVVESGVEIDGRVSSGIMTHKCSCSLAGMERGVKVDVTVCFIEICNLRKSHICVHRCVL